MTSSPSSERVAAAHKLGAIRAELRARFVERDDVIDGLLSALLAGEHVLLLGPPGTAKSMLANELCSRLVGGTWFSWLLTKFSTPEELFGPVSLTALERDEFRRVTAGKLPQAHIAFLDEIFKASSAILNALLSVINERVYHNGAAVETVPLISLVGASNELPEAGELGALFDRFLLRFVVDYIEEDFRFLKMLTLPSAPETTTRLDLGELDALREAAAALPIDERLLGDLVALRQRLNERNIVVSDRRYRASLRLLRAHALLAGRARVDDSDFEILRHVLWNDPAQRDEVRAALTEVFRGHVDEANALLAQAREVKAYALRGWDDAEMAMRASIEAHTKLKNLLVQAERLHDTAAGRGRRLDELDELLEALRTIQREVLENTLHV